MTHAAPHLTVTLALAPVVPADAPPVVIMDRTDLARYMRPRPTCPHVTVRIPDPRGRVRYLEQCVRCEAVIGEAAPGPIEPCRRLWGLASAAEPHTPEEIATLRARVGRGIA